AQHVEPPRAATVDMRAGAGYERLPRETREPHRDAIVLGHVGPDAQFAVPAAGCLERHRDRGPILAEGQGRDLKGRRWRAEDLHLEGRRRAAVEEDVVAAGARRLPPNRRTPRLDS